MEEAKFYSRLESSSIRCELCPWFCVLKPGDSGNCKVRKNEDGKLIAETFNKKTAIAFDPIEKKPLYHFFPGAQILSVGSAGCNLHCSFCQNHNISQCSADGVELKEINSDQLINLALSIQNNIGIAYTYNEPFTFYEFMFETAAKAKVNGLKNVVISNGYINPKPLKMILPFIDAFNIDLKAFSETFYKNQTNGKLAPVLQTLKIIAAADSHLEITNLVIPGLNDNETDFERMVQWIAAELGEDVPLHLSRYFPRFMLKTGPTPNETLNRLFVTAKRYLQFVYLGNVPEIERSSTFCPSCGTLLLKRDGYSVKIQNVSKKGFCTNCDAPVEAIFE